MIKNFKNNNYALVLSGGGALGIAHLGIINDLEKLELNPAQIIGTSIGALIGACVAIGMKEKDIFLLFVKFSNILSMIKLSFSGNSIIGSEKISIILDSVFSNMKIRDTQIALKIVTTNFSTGNVKVFDSNDDIEIKDALLASIAIPGIFEERHIDNIVYSDGFLCENLGVSHASYKNVLAIDVLGGNSFESNLPNNFLKISNVLEMFEKSIRVLIYNQTKAILKSSTKNIYLVEPDTKKYKTFHFGKYEKLRAVGLNLLK